MPLPDLHQAEAIPTAAQDDLNRILQNGDLFRYTAASDAPVTLLEQEFAQMLGARFALAVSSCSAALFLSLKALGLPRDARVLIPGFTFAAVPSAGRITAVDRKRGKDELGVDLEHGQVGRGLAVRGVVGELDARQRPQRCEGRHEPHGRQRVHDDRLQERRVALLEGARNQEEEVGRQRR